LQKDAGTITPLFIARAGRDEVPTMDDSIDRFVKEALAKNIALTFANHPQGVHGFDNQNDAYGFERSDHFPRPKWRRSKPIGPSVLDLLNLLRSSLFARASRSLTEPKPLPITTSTEHEVLGL
jgi:hypothetical protein